ncbi:MAG: dehydrogenase [Paludibacteraceae bacterium]|nr:dehydrogenase [Paludibacteraceae bacterium]
MADGYLESHYAEYEKRKAEWLKKQHRPNSSKDQQNPWRDL